VGNPSEAIFGPLPTTVPTPFTGSGAFGDFGSGVSYADPGIGTEHLAAALLYGGSGNPINQVASVWPGLAATATGKAADELAGFPSSEQGQDFLGQPLFAPVSAGSADDLVIGGDSGAVDARLSSGAEAAGFPKFTGGWTVYAPAAGDLFGNGRDDLVTITREGYLFAWTTSGAAPGDGSWWRAFHDEYNSGRLGTDSRPPGVVRSAKLSGTTLSFSAPGAHWYDGEASTYQYVDVNSAGRAFPPETLNVEAAAGALVRVTVPAGTVAVIIRAVNSDGLVSNSEKCTSAGEVTVAWPS
jgi:hypothetical protein